MHDIYQTLLRADREVLVRILESICIQCYDQESNGVLLDAIFENLDDGTLDERDVWNLLEN